MARTRGRRLHLSVLAVILVGAFATVVGFAYSQSSAHRNDDALLREEAGQGGFVLNSILGQYNASFSALGTSVVPGASSQPNFLAAAAKAAGQSDGTSVALVQLAPTPHVVAQVGTAADGGLASAVSFLRSSNVPSTPHILGVDNNGKDGILEQVAGYPVTPPGYALLWEIVTPTVVQLQSIKGLPFSGVNASLYFGSDRPADLFFATTTKLPLTGERAVVPMAEASGGISFPAARIDSGSGTIVEPGQLFLVMSPTSHLSGEAAALYPWITLTVGLLATLVVALVLSMALWRRDEALGLVGELKAKNTELDDALSAQAQAEEHLRQAQHLEAVGQLAGGIAHDFNNLLHVILSYTAFLERGLPVDSPLRPDLLEVRSAAQRAAELTRQLLVFARREMVRPEVLEANSVVRGTELLLRHTLGEDVDLRIQTAGTPCHFLGDLGECKQVLVNLAINARDAMPKGGTLRIGVRRVDVDAAAATAMGVDAGAYVRIDVSDDGTGMAPEVVARAFEPFFTTKETGRGTGLGLAMVYGIASRWNGTALISSQLGQGTTITLYLPLTEEPAVDGETLDFEGPAVDKVIDEAKVVLLVEDQEQVRRSTARILQSAGYQVVQAENADEADNVFDANACDLLLTDVVMPGGRSGKDLADGILRRRPDFPVVFVTGYGSDAMTERGILPANVTLLEKPFQPEDLLRTLEEVFHDGAGAR